MATKDTEPTPADLGADGLLTGIEPVVVSDKTSDKDVEPEPAPEEVHLKDIQGVRYIGNSDVRLLSVADLAKVDVDAKKDLRWDASNERFVSKDDLNAATLHYLVAQPDFRAE